MPTRSFLWVSLLTCLGLLALQTDAAVAQTEVTVQPAEPQYSFGSDIEFRAVIQSPTPIAEVQLLTQNGGGEPSQVTPASIDPQGNVYALYNLNQFPLRAFSDVDYWYLVTLQDGRIFKSPGFRFRFEDKRFPWKTLASPPFVVHWYAGDVSFAQEILNVAQAGREHSMGILGDDFQIPSEVDIYAYDNAEQMRTALLLSSQKWAAGHADPDLGVILVSLPDGPEQHLEMERQVPHELMHVALYNIMGANYKNLPTWFNEGLASMAEMYPNPDYQVMLESAYRSGAMISMASLCRAFPTQRSQALQAYSQSASFMRFIYDQFGADGFNRMIAAFVNGQGCERGVEGPLGSSLARLENTWQQEIFTENAWRSAIADLFPWLVLLVVLLVVPIILMLSMLRRRQGRVEI